MVVIAVRNAAEKAKLVKRVYIVVM